MAQTRLFYKCLKIVAGGIAGLAGDNDVSVVLHEGNVNGDTSVNLLDLQAVKSQLLQAVSAANARDDVTCDKAINLLDLQAVKGNLLAPAACP